MRPVAQESEAAIVEARAHADAVAVGIETHQGHEDEVQALRWCDLAIASAWLKDTEAVAATKRLAAVAHEPEPTWRMPAQHRKVPTIAALASVPEPISDRGRIELAIGRVIERDAPRRAEQFAAEQALADRLRVRALLARTELAAESAELSAKLGVGQVCCGHSLAVAG